MKIKMLFLTLCLTAFTSGVFAQLSNGSFEDGTDPGVFTTVSSGDNTTITGWLVSSGNVDYIGNYWQASNGSRSVDLNGLMTGSISQTFATTPGATYQVTFDMSGNPDGAPSLKELSVDVGGSSNSYSYDTSVQGNTRPDMKYVAYTYSFTAPASMTTLTFSSETEEAFGPVVDNVVLTQLTFAVCHYNNGRGNNGPYKTLFVDSQNAVDAHVREHTGDSAGVCTQP